MRSLVCACLMALVSLAAGAVELTLDNFAETVKTKDAAFVMLHAPWCGHCKQAKPHFDAIQSHVDTFFVDAGTPEAEDLRKEFDVKGFPTFLLMKDGVVVDRYEGDRTTPAFTSYLVDMVPPPSPSADSEHTDDHTSAPVDADPATNDEL